MRHWLGVLIYLLLMPSAVTALETCRVEKSVCLDNVEPKVVGGKNFYFSDFGITDACWDWARTYRCEAEPVNNCAFLDDSGCVLLSASCALKGFDNKCVREMRSYRCGSNINPQNTVTVDNTYTLLESEKSYDGCSGADKNGACTLSAQSCVDGPSFKVILADGTHRLPTQVEIDAGRSQDGLLLFQECWAWSNTYSCIAPDESQSCEMLIDSGCKDTAPVQCLATGWNGSCLNSVRTIQCADSLASTPSNISLYDTIFSVVSDNTESNCDGIANNLNCSSKEDVCVEGLETRVVAPDGVTREATPTEVTSRISSDGAVVTKDCWKTEHKYTCAGTGTYSQCGDFESNPDCKYIESKCIDNLPDGTCALLENTYECKTEPDSTRTEIDCGTQKFCLNGSCFDTSYSPDQDFALAIGMKEALREAGSYSIFRGEATSCENKLWGLGNCCKSKGGGQAGKNSNIVGKMGLAGATYAGERVVEIGSSYMYDALFEFSASSTYSFLGDAVAGSVEQGLFSAATPSATLSLYGVSWSSSAGLANQGLMGANQLLGGSSTSGYLYFNPYAMVAAVVFQVIMNYLECDEDEQKLSMKRGQNLCHRVGSWCSRKILGSCEKKKEGWCCFPSVLGRIVNEQGRMQIGKGWGSPKNPDCSGFTEVELQMLRFDQMDLSQFLSSIAPNVKVSDIARQRINDRLNTEPKSYYETVRGN